MFAAAACTLLAHSLRANSKPAASPTYVDSPRPLLSWQLALAPGLPSSTFAAQAAYRVVASLTRDGVPSGVFDAWDSGWVESNATLGVMYGGTGLAAVGEGAFWSVLVRDAGGAEATAPPVEALVRAPGAGAGDWAGAIWVSANSTLQGSDCACYDEAENTAPALRVAFIVPTRAPVVDAHLFFVGLGFAEAFVSGSRVGSSRGGGASESAPAAAAARFAAAPGDPGAREGDEVLAPPWTTFALGVLYAAHNVTALLAGGGAAGSAQVLGLILGRGWWDPPPMRFFAAFNLREHYTVGRPQALALLVLRLADGSQARVTSGIGGGWVWAPTPLLKNGIHLGETVDLRLAAPLEGWAAPGFNASGWAPVLATDQYRAGGVRLNPQPPTRIGATWPPSAVTARANGDFIMSFPLEVVGWLSVGNISGPRGTTITFTFAEVLAADGDIDPFTTVAGDIGMWDCPQCDWGACAPLPAVQADVVVLAGGGSEAFTPRFTWHAFRHVRVRGWPTAAAGPPRAEQFAALATYADNAPAGEFAASAPVHAAAFDALASNSLRGNWAGGIQADPGRERFGYGGDALVVAEAALLQFDAAAFYAKRADDHAAAQGPTGNIPETAPFMGIDSCVAEGGGNMQWGAALSEIASLLLAYAGDTALAARALAPAAAFAEYLAARTAPDGTLINGLADGYWPAADGGCTGPVAGLIGSAYYARQLALLAELSAAVGAPPEEAAVWAARAAAAAFAFRAAYFDEATGVVGVRSGNGTVAPMARPDATLWALRNGVLGPPASPGAARAAATLATRFAADRGEYELGPFSTSALMSHGHEWTPPGGDPARGLADAVYAFLDSDAWPGYGYELAHGATTLWETWSTNLDGVPQNGSFCHAWFGSVATFLRRVEGGLGPAPGARGFDRVLVKPVPPRLAGAAGRSAAWANVSYASARGPLAVRWTLDGRAPTRFAVAVSAPANVRVTVELPLRAPVEGGADAGAPAFAACAWAPPFAVDEAAGVARWQLDGFTECAFEASWPG